MDMQQHTCGDTRIHNLEILTLTMDRPHQPLAEVEVSVTDDRGFSSSYRTDQQGRIAISGLEPDSVVTATITKDSDGFVFEEKTVSVKIIPNNTHEICFFATPLA